MIILISPMLNYLSEFHFGFQFSITYLDEVAFVHEKKYLAPC